MKRTKFELQLFADLDTVIESNKAAFEGVDIKTQYSTIAEKLSALGYEVLINNKKEAEFVPSHRLGEVVAQRETFKTQTNELTKQLEELKKSAAGNVDLQNQVQALIDQNTKLNADLEQTRVNSEIMLEAKDAIDPADVLLFINKEKISTDKQGKVLGVKEELDRLRKEKPHLFDTKKTKGGMDLGGGSGEKEKLNMNNMIRSAAGKTGRL